MMAIFISRLQSQTKPSCISVDGGRNFGTVRWGIHHRDAEGAEKLEKRFLGTLCASAGGTRFAANRPNTCDAGTVMKKCEPEGHLGARTRDLKQSLPSARATAFTTRV